MFIGKLGLTGLIGALGLGLAGCTDGYGYSGVGMGWGNGGYYDDGFYGAPGGWGGGGWGGPGWGGVGYAPSYFGWYGDYYYPGTGGFVYDRWRRPFAWNNDQRRYWQSRRNGFQDRDVRANWRDFGRDVRNERRDYRGDLRDNRQAFRDGTINRDQFRQGRRDARQEYRGDVRQDYRDLRRANRAEGYRTPRPNRAFNPGRPRAGFGPRQAPTRNYRPIRPAQR